MNYFLVNINKNNLLGCFFKVGFNPNLEEHELKDIANKFYPYIFKEKGIAEKIKKLEFQKYGTDIELILFQFNVLPSENELLILKPIEPYRKKEKAIGIPIIITEENFFTKLEKEKYDFLKSTMLEKLDLLLEVVNKKKLDTNVAKIKEDLSNIDFY